MDTQWIFPVWVLAVLCSAVTAQIRGGADLDGPPEEATRYYSGTYPQFRCPPGWWLIASECEDINECRGQYRPCSGRHTVCRNTVGSYRCQCRRGYLGDPYSYEGCAPDPGICDPFTTTSTVLTSDTTITETTTDTTTSTTTESTTTETTTESTTATTTTESTTATTTSESTTATTTTESTTPIITTESTTPTTTTTTPGPIADLTTPTLPDLTFDFSSPQPTDSTTATSTSGSTSDITGTTPHFTTPLLPDVPPGYSRCLKDKLSSGSFYRLHTRPVLSWDAAQARCALDHPRARLVTMADQHVNDCLKTWFLFHTNVYFAWIGLRYEGDTFRWRDGSLPLAFQNWGRDQPFRPAARQCVRLYSQRGIWETADCQDLYAFFCEIEPF